LVRYSPSGCCRPGNFFVRIDAPPQSGSPKNAVTNQTLGGCVASSFAKASAGQVRLPGTIQRSPRNHVPAIRRRCPIRGCSPGWRHLPNEASVAKRGIGFGFARRKLKVQESCRLHVEPHAKLLGVLDRDRPGTSFRAAASTRNIFEAGIRPYYWIADNIAIQGQAFGSYQDNVRGFQGTTAYGRSGSMGVFTIAPRSNRRADISRDLNCASSQPTRSGPTRSEALPHRLGKAEILAEFRLRLTPAPSPTTDGCLAPKWNGSSEMIVAGRVVGGRQWTKLTLPSNSPSG
jgi:hypothetical protein